MAVKMMSGLGVGYGDICVFLWVEWLQVGGSSAAFPTQYLHADTGAQVICSNVCDCDTFFRRLCY